MYPYLAEVVSQRLSLESQPYVVIIVVLGGRTGRATGRSGAL
jgi:hypothetical protein